MHIHKVKNHMVYLYDIIIQQRKYINNNKPFNSDKKQVVLINSKPLACVYDWIRIHVISLNKCDALPSESGGRGLSFLIVKYNGTVTIIFKLI